MSPLLIYGIWYEHTNNISHKRVGCRIIVVNPPFLPTKKSPQAKALFVHKNPGTLIFIFS
jgi:methylase of polypeptide subunit release factors